MVEAGGRHAALAVCALLLAACAGEQPKEQVQPVSAPAQSARPAPPPSTRPVGQASVPADPLSDPNGILSKRSVYYGYDQYDVSSEYLPLVQAHAGYLREHPGAKVAIQGNCDERGSPEYNLALGQRRAERVSKAMSLLGVPDAQMEAVSFGEEKPKAAGHDEASWAQNRRSDIVYERSN